MKKFKKMILYSLCVIILSSCQDKTSNEICAEFYVSDYEYITLEDGSVITGKPIYRCRVFRDEIEIE